MCMLGGSLGAQLGVRQAPITPNESLSKNATPDPSHSLVEEDTLAWDTHMYFMNPTQSTSGLRG